MALRDTRGIAKTVEAYEVFVRSYCPDCHRRGREILVHCITLECSIELLEEKSDFFFLSRSNDDIDENDIDGARSTARSLCWHI
ncbi:hypothetical protein KM043_004117 [Ampulex compressa]|nr:hypothetical protein KM043_004117 [Ampulex compressa]